MWILHFLQHLGVLLVSPPALYSDNIHYVSPVILSHARIKHIEIYYHFVLEKVVVGAMVPKYVPSATALTKQQFQFLRSKL